MIKNRKEVENFIKNEVVTTSEAAEILGVTRQRVSQMISAGKRGDSLFLKSNIEEEKKELEVLRKNIARVTKNSPLSLPV